MYLLLAAGVDGDNQEDGDGSQRRQHWLRRMLGAVRAIGSPPGSVMFGQRGRAVEQLPQHVGHDAAVAVVVRLTRGVDT